MPSELLPEKLVLSPLRIPEGTQHKTRVVLLLNSQPRYFHLAPDFNIGFGESAEFVPGFQMNWHRFYPVQGRLQPGRHTVVWFTLRPLSNIISFVVAVAQRIAQIPHTAGWCRVENDRSVSGPAPLEGCLGFMDGGALANNSQYKYIYQIAASFATQPRFCSSFVTLLLIFCVKKSRVSASCQ